MLGPALFLLFINDLPLFVNEAYLDFYADDSTVHTSNKQQLKVQNDLQQGSDNFENLCSRNDMLVHLKKDLLHVDWNQAITRENRLTRFTYKKNLMMSR